MKLKNARATAFVLGMTLFISVFAAEHSHQKVKPRHGGVVVEVADVEYELARRNDAHVIFVSDHGKSVQTKGWSGTIAIVGGEKQSAELVGTSDSVLEIKGQLNIKAGTRLLATIQAPGKKPVQVRFSSK